MNALALLLLLASADPGPVGAISYTPDGSKLIVGADNQLAAIGTETLRATVAGRITAIAVHPDGKAVAIAFGKPGTAPTVQLATTETLKSSGTFDGPTDSVLALTFSPDGAHLAAASYDRKVYVWNVAEKKSEYIVTDHSDSVFAVAFSPDGNRLASTGADRAVKIREAASGKLLYTLSDAQDGLNTLAWSPDGKRIAAAGIDKMLRIWNVGETEGKQIVANFAHQAAVTRIAYSPDGKTIYTFAEDQSFKSWNAETGVERKAFPKMPATPLSLAVRSDGKAIAVGLFDGRVVTIDAIAGKVLETYWVNSNEREPNDSVSTAQAIEFGATIYGQVNSPGDADVFRIELKTGQELGIEVQTDSKLSTLLECRDPDGRVIASSIRNKAGFKASQDGRHVIQLRDRDYRGGSGFGYRLHVGNVSVVTGVFPLAVTAGKDCDVEVTGVNFDLKRRFTAVGQGKPGDKVPIQIGGDPRQVLDGRQLVISEFPTTNNDVIAVPGAADGRLRNHADIATWKFVAKKGVPLVVEVEAQRFGSPFDPVIEILDKMNKPVPRAILRAVAKTSVVLRDHDANGAGVRLDSWADINIDDHLLIGQDVMKVLALPKSPDDDTQMYRFEGRRLSYLGTTPQFHALGSPIYKVEVHPPAAKLPPNGLPTFPINYRNDDGGGGYGKDSYLIFDPPADGTYQVRVSDSRGEFGPNHAFRVTVRPPRPNFSLSVSPKAPSVHRGGCVPLIVTATRKDGFNGQITVILTGFPAEFSTQPATIEAGQTTCVVPLFAADNAGKLAAKTVAIHGTAQIDREAIRDLEIGEIKVIDPGEITTNVKQPEAVLKPGQETTIDVVIERYKGFKGRVPLEVDGLPHGVRVLHIGLNGILITEKETERRVILYAEPWVKPMTVPLVVAAKHEGKNTLHGAKPIVLRIEK